MPKPEPAVCNSGPKLIFACSGAADVGAVSDHAARRLTKEGVGSMFCLAGVGGRVQPIMDRTLSASSILAIDGCSLNCVGETLKQAGIDSFQHIVVTDLGLEKGHTEVNNENIQTVVAKGQEVLAD